MKRENDTAFQMGASNLRFGRGTTREVGMDLVDMGIERVLVITDPNLVNLPPVQTAREALEAEGIAYHVFDRVRVEPTDISFKEAIEVATEGQYEGYVAVGGGSSMDTAKAPICLPPIPTIFSRISTRLSAGQTRARPGQTPHCHPHHRRHGQRDHGGRDYGPLGSPRQNRHCPPASQARPRDCRSRKHAHHALCNRSGHWPGCAVPTPWSRSPPYPIPSVPLPQRPIERPAYQGSNPISDMWALKAIEMTAQYLPRAVATPMMTRPAHRCSSPHRSRASALAMPAFTSATACPIRCRAWCAISSPKA